jgi:hypothetical protein
LRATVTTSFSPALRVESEADIERFEPAKALLAHRATAVAARPHILDDSMKQGPLGGLPEQQGN